MNDEKKGINYIVIYNLIFAALVIALGLYVMLFTDMFDRDYRDHIRDLSDNWQTLSGHKIDTDYYSLKDCDGEAEIIKPIPKEVTDNDDLCFESDNVNLEVYINDELKYSYETKENLTGMGYGYAFHTVGMTRDMKGKILRLKFRSVTPQSNRGKITNIYMGPAADYIHKNIADNILSFLLTLLIIFFGAALILVWAGISKKSDLPVDILDLGVASVLMGFWLMSNIKIMQLLTGKVILWRVIDRMAIILAMYPFIRFFNSVTRLKRRFYVYLAFFQTVGLGAALLVMRYIFGIDTLVSFSKIQMFSVLITFMIVAAMQVENFNFCKKNSLPLEHKGVYIGMAFLFLCAFAEALLYLFKGGYKANGTIIMVGMLFFTISVLLQFINWWISDQAAMDRDRFVNRSLQFAVSSKNPVDSIKLLLEYMGKEMGARRTVIYEDMNDGSFQNTYEWYQEGQYPLSKEMLVIPYKGFVDQIYDRMLTEEKYVQIEDVEKIKTELPILYEKLKKIGTFRLVAGALRSEDHLIGIFCMGDIPPENFKNITEIMGIISYFFAQFINQRKEQERILFYSYHEPLSGAKNRSALKEFTEQKLDLSQAFGYVICEITGLKEINENMGHDYGDNIVVKVSECLREAFGDENVYRVSGEEFVCFGFESDETFFGNDVERAKRLLREKECNVAIGSAYCSNGTMDLKNVARYVRSVMEQCT